MNERIKQLVDERIKALAAAQEIVDAALREGRELTSEEEANVAKASEAALLAQRAIQLEEQREEAEKRAAEMAERVPTASTPEVKRENPLRQVIEMAREGRVGSGWLPGLPCVGDEYILPWERRADTPLTTTDTSTTYSGYLVPTQLANYIEDVAYKSSAILQAGADVIVTPGVGQFTLPKIAAKAQFGIVSEGLAAANSSQPTFGRTQFGAYMVGGHAVVTQAELASTEVDLAAVLQRALGDALAETIAGYLATGTGLSQPQGVFVGATSGVTSSVAGSFTYDDLVSLMGALGAQYWSGAKWLFSQAAFVELLKLKDLEDRPLFQNDPTAGAIGTVLGFPVFVDAQGPSVASANKPVVLCQPRHYHVRIGMGGGVQYEVSREAQFTQFNTVIRIAQYVDAKVGVAEAVKALTIA